MKRTFSLLLVLTMVFSLMFALTSCGEPKTTVTAEEFEAAANYDGDCTMSVTTSSATSGKMEMIMKLSGTKVESTTKVTDDDGEVESMTMFYEFLDDVTYMYYPDTDESGETVGYVKMSSDMTYDEMMEDMAASMMPEELLDYETYTYDETSKTYKAASVTFEMYGEQIELQDVEMAFADAKLMTMSYKMDMGGDETTCTITYDYATPTITLPTENVTDMTEGAA